MSRTIYKYRLQQIRDRFSVPMPAGAQIVHVASQGGWPCIWAIVDTDAPEVVYDFELRGTGHELGSVGDHIGTFQLDGGGLVFHLFHGATQ